MMAHVISRRAVLVGLAASAIPVFPARAHVIRDITGRVVSLETPVKKVLLGEGRFLAALSLLGLHDPLSRIAGMLGDFERYDQAGFDRWRSVYPQIAHIPIFGHTSGESISLEMAISLKPDVAIFGVEGHGPGAHSQRILETLEAAGIPVVFIDFRRDPLGNTGPSLKLLGRLFGKQKAANECAAFHDAAVARVIDRIESLSIPRPRVLLEIHVGLRPSCCFTMAKGSLADLIEAAGGSNIARGKVPGVAGPLNLEHILAEQPDIYIGTAVGTETAGSDDFRIALGPGVSGEAARKSLQKAVSRTGVSSLSCVRNGQAFGIWHHFYNSPLNSYALETFASWFYPDLFSDIDPEKGLTWMLDRSKPINLAGTYAVGSG